MPDLELEKAVSRAVNEGTVKLVLSAPTRESTLRRVTVQRLGETWQAETLTATQAFHQTLGQQELRELVCRTLRDSLSQLHAWDKTHEYAVRVTAKGRVLQTRRPCASAPAVRTQHDRQKNYLLPQGEDIPALVDMGIFTKDGRVAAPMDDKYRQINRFVELVDDALSALPDRGDRPFTVLDFGCGKSYLTFVLYHYFTRVRGLPVRMVGLDLKQDVITRCNETARRYGYDGLRFELGDINGYDIDCPVDMVVTLHACDTATDHALFHAVRWEVPLILSVPCCQHEVNGQIKAKELSLLTHYGIVKERFSALLTDALRANLLVCCGYRTQLLEFVDFAHTPKNLLIRAVRGKVPQTARDKALQEVKACLEQFGVWPTLPRLLQEAGLVRGLEAPEQGGF